MKTYQEIPPAEALKRFAGRNIRVQTATPNAGKVKPINVAEGDVKNYRDGTIYDVKMEPLAEKHILSAKLWADGAVTITTIDGQRHVAARSVPLDS